jgi:hypothetical protein
LQQFVSGPKGESFSVSGVSFSYADSRVTDAFNHTSYYGGPLKSDADVRICYDPSDRAILRLEIRGFTGEVKNYARPWTFFFTAEHFGGQNADPGRQRPRFETPWSAYLAFAVAALDFIAIQLLFLPYLRTFFRLKSAALLNCSVPSSLESGTRIKLRNSMIWWDLEARAIWLRPRGLNALAVPFMVARLDVDANGTSVAAGQIRLSSGLPFAAALLFLSNYMTFKSIFPHPDMSALAFFLAFNGLGLSMVGYFAVRLLLSRMGILVGEAVTELNGMSGPWHPSTRHQPA